MLIIRPTLKLATKIDATPLQTIESSPNPLLDWHASLFTFQRSQYILVMNTVTQYAACFYGAGNSDITRFMKSFYSSVGDQMKLDGLGEGYTRLLAEHADGIIFAKASSRSATGTMVEYIKMAPDFLADQAPPYFAARCNELIWAPLDYKTPRSCLEKICQRDLSP